MTYVALRRKLSSAKVCRLQPFHDSVFSHPRLHTKRSFVDKNGCDADTTTAFCPPNREEQRGEHGVNNPGTRTPHKLLAQGQASKSAHLPEFMTFMERRQRAPWRVLKCRPLSRLVLLPSAPLPPVARCRKRSGVPTAGICCRHFISGGVWQSGGSTVSCVSAGEREVRRPYMPKAETKVVLTRLVKMSFLLRFVPHFQMRCER